MLSESTLLAAVASPRRREILRLVWRDELSAGDIHRAMPDVTAGAVSLQLRALGDAGLVVCRPDRRHRYYRARREACGPVGAMLEAMWSDALWRLKLQAELEATRRGPRRSRAGAGVGVGAFTTTTTTTPTTTTTTTTTTRTSKRSA